MSVIFEQNPTTTDDDAGTVKIRRATLIPPFPYYAGTSHAEKYIKKIPPMKSCLKLAPTPPGSTSPDPFHNPIAVLIGIVIGAVATYAVMRHKRS